MIYLVCFSVSVFFAHVAKKATNKKRFIFWSLASILVMAFLAGFRDITIGIDTENFYNNTWTIANNSNRNFFDFFLLYFSRWNAKEYLYAILVGLVAKTTGSTIVVLFIFHFIIVGCVYIGAFRTKEHAHPELTLLLFYLLYYNHSLNIFRQYIAMAILFAFFADIEQGHHLRYFFGAILAFFFHNSGILGLVPLFLYKMLYPRGKRQFLPIWRKTVTASLLILFTITFGYFGKALLNLGIINAKYLYVFESESTHTYITARLFILTEAILLIFFIRSYRENNTFADYYLFCSFSFALLYQIAPSMPYGKRIPAYFSLINLVSIGMLQKNAYVKGNRVLFCVAIVIVAFSYWLFIYVIHNGSQTMPYVFGF